MDDIVITGSDSTGISSLKSFPYGQLYTKDLGMLKYFLGVEVMRSNYRRVNLTILSSTGTPVQVLFCWWCMRMILLSLGVTLQESHPLSPFFTTGSIQRT